MIAAPRFHFLSSLFVFSWIGLAPAAPAAGPWQAGTAIPSAIRTYAFAQNGEDFYVIGGFDSNTNPVTTVRRYNATTNIWTSLANLPVASSGGAAAFFNGKIYATDGIGSTAVRVYDIATNTWGTSAISRPGVDDSYGAAAGAYAGKLYIVGGGSQSAAFRSVLSIYDIATNTWTTGTNAPGPFFFGGSVQSGQFLYLIGSGTDTANSQTSMRLDMAAGTWSTGPAWTPARVEFALAAAGTRLIAMGGFEDVTFALSAQVNELETSTWPSGTWVASPDNLPSARADNSAGFVSTGRAGGEIWSTGGATAGGVTLRDHIFRAEPTCTAYRYAVGTGSIVPGTTDTLNHTDDASTLISLPFTYRLYDQDFTSVNVGSNGQLTFVGVNDQVNPGCIPVGATVYVIAPYWTDQCTGTCTGVTGTGLGIFTSVSGVAPNRIFNIEWRTRYFNNQALVLNYEVRLYEGQQSFDLIYGTVSPLASSSGKPLSVGVQKSASGAQFTLVGCDSTGGTAPPVSSGQLYRFTSCGVAPAPPGFLYALTEGNGSNNQIYGFSVNETTGALTALGGFPVATGGTGEGSAYPESLLIDPVNQRLYAINEGSDTVSAFVINPFSGALAPMFFSPVALGAGAWTTLAVHPSGSPLLVGGFSTGITSFNITSSTASAAAGSPFSSPDAYSSTLSRNGDYYYEGGDGSSFGGFSVNPSNGVLTPLAGSPYSPGGDSSSAYETDSQGRLLTSGYGNGSLRAYTTSSGIPSDVTGNSFASGLTNPQAGALHPNERLYLALSFSDQLGSFLVRGSGSGTTLTPAAGSPFSSAAPAPNDLTMNQTGAFLFGVHFTTRTISSFRVDPNTGVLSNPSALAADSLGFGGPGTSIAHTNASMVRTAVSRKTHGSAGVFDVNLPLTGTPGVECRNGSGASSNDHQIIIAFKAPVTVASIELLSGNLGNAILSTSGQVATIDLTGVTNAQTVVLRLNGVTDGVNTGTVVLPIGFLVGDVNASRAVTNTDVSSVKGQVSSPVTGSNFRNDVNATGAITNTDVSTTKGRVSTTLP